MAIHLESGKSEEQHAARHDNNFPNQRRRQGRLSLGLSQHLLDQELRRPLRRVVRVVSDAQLSSSRSARTSSATAQHSEADDRVIHDAHIG
eukprot:3934132-Rhodomonas_salina.6